MKLNCYDWADGVQSTMIKTRHYNNVIDHTSAVYIVIKTDLSWLIEQDVVYHEK